MTPVPARRRDNPDSRWQVLKARAEQGQQLPARRRQIQRVLKVTVHPEPQRFARAMLGKIADRGHFKREERHGPMPEKSTRDQPRNPSITAAAWLTQPKIAPCALIISSADFWNSGKYEPTQSAGMMHSYPRSLASRTVVVTQTSVVTPHTMSVLISWFFRIS